MKKCHCRVAGEFFRLKEQCLCSMGTEQGAYGGFRHARGGEKEKRKGKKKGLDAAFQLRVSLGLIDPYDCCDRHRIVIGK